ncbi:hypothetical protein K493DRAFT_317599 [Basidiobolus meristosporus CBS 931.73]|uniref:F-box domain-containing protein n=1 Tax=Basidiobolus meristosporus CBS 931.73 TaxID=1314790 RepID=A0A1Y1XZ34_9FUNG|nr:hypothetical protein K493DRAFT_317599 [Basidiobolus meristosporus CBS 931.73]|eukprot:ORX90989.1 hypothetical protein K493DRAFT_317599 [Basidiobolus meristosporus CBS 931.73]
MSALILLLPEDCWDTIFSYLNLDDLLNLSLQCKPLYDLLTSRQDSLWRTRLSEFFPGLTKDIRVVPEVPDHHHHSYPEIKYLRLGVPGALRNTTPECPLGWRYPSIPRLNTAKNLCLLLRKISNIQDALVNSILQTSKNTTTASPHHQARARSTDSFAGEKRFVQERGTPNRLLELIEFQERFDLTLPVDYVYFLLKHAHKFWWNPEWLRMSSVPGDGSFVFTGPSPQHNGRSEFRVIPSESLLDHHPEPYLGELVESQYDYWKYLAGERRFLRITSPVGEESERYLLLEVTDHTESDFGAVYYVNNAGDSRQPREFDEEDYMPRTPLWSHFTFTDFLGRFAKASLTVNLVPHRFFYQVGFHEEFKNFLEETELFERPQKTFTTQVSCLHVTRLPFPLSDQELLLEENIGVLNTKERKCTCTDDSDW